MPLYEFRCKKCGGVTTFLERMFEIKFWRRKCEHCGSRRLEKVLSAFSTHKNESYTDMLNEMKRMGNVNFVPQYPRPMGPPPGGCPYEQDSVDSKEDTSPKQETITLSDKS